MLSDILCGNSIIEILLLFYTHSFSPCHVAAGLHDFNVGHRDYDKKRRCGKYPLMLLRRTLSVYDLRVDACADLVECIVGWQRGWFSEEAGRRAHLCSREYDRCQSSVADSVRAALHRCLQYLFKSGVCAGIVCMGY